MRFGSLFAGIGGFDLGFERAGLSCRWQVEINPFCQKVLEKHWPKVIRRKDIRNFPPPKGDWSVDVICGGFPCKQTSTAAAPHHRRTGLAGEDSGLWFEMLRVVRLVQPRWVVVENVAGAKSWEETITSGLADAGYKGVRPHPFEVSAEGVGAPHRRSRLFWLAHRTQPGLETPRFPDPPRREGRQWCRTERHPWDGPLPRGVRVADGVPRRLDRRVRIVAVGNAVVPQVAEMIGKYLLDCDAVLRRLL